MYKAKAYAAASATSPLAGTTIPRRDPTEHDVQIEILFCGICHSDLHSVRNEWSEFMPTVYPIVPGHEIVGRVTKIGSAVTKFKAGRPRRGRLPGRLGPHLPPLQGGA
jgi:alcohol dehydrogenase (NADP+)